MATGLPGAAKSYLTAQITVSLVKRNREWFKRTGKVRPVYSNLVMSDSFTEQANAPIESLRDELGEPLGFETKPGEVFIKYWEDPEELPDMHDADVVWEEMGAHVDSRSWESLPLTLRRWLQQHRHRGVEIYGNCQDFADVDVAIRRLCGSLVYLTKVVGSRDPSATTPAPRVVWGIVVKMYLDPRNYKEETKTTSGVFGGFIWINKAGVELYSMHNDIKPGKYPALQHRERICPTCNFKKVLHV